MRTFQPKLAAIALVLLFTSCQAPRTVLSPPHVPSPDERATMQTNIYAGQYDMVFAATIAVLQDTGWRLDVVDKPAGLIRAISAHKAESLGPEDERSTNLQNREAAVRLHADITRKWARWQELVIHTEPWGMEHTRQRIVLNQRGTLPAMSYSEEQNGTWYRHGRQVLVHAPPEEQTVEVDLPEAYRHLFERIQKALIQRQKLNPGNPA